TLACAEVTQRAIIAQAGSLGVKGWPAVRRPLSPRLVASRRGGQVRPRQLRSVGNLELLAPSIQLLFGHRERVLGRALLAALNAAELNASVHRHVDDLAGSPR